MTLLSHFGCVAVRQKEETNTIVGLSLSLPLCYRVRFICIVIFTLRIFCVSTMPMYHHTIEKFRNFSIYRNSKYRSRIKV